MGLHIVIGGTGHLGNVVLKKLVEQGKRVKALILPGEDLTPIKDLDIELSYGDILDKEFLEKEIIADSYVYHMAGIVDIGSVKRQIMYDVNINGTKNVIDVCEKNKVKRLVYTSSVHVIFEGKDKEVLYEPTVFESDKIVGDYAKTKTIATKYIFERIKEGNLDAVVVYPSGIIGPFDYKISNFGQLIYDYMHSRVLARVDGVYNFVDVRDVSDGVIAAMEKGRKGEGYTLSGDLVTVGEFFSWLEEKTHIKQPPKLKMWFAKLFAKSAELYYKARKRRPLFSKYSLYTLTANCNFSNKKAVDELDFKVRPLQQSTNDAVDWFKENIKE